MTRSLFAIFSDDVRLEVGNKLSYMGCYTGSMVVPQMPLMLPKLCVVMHAITPAANPFKELRFRLLKNDEVVSEQEANLDVPPLPLPFAEGEEVSHSVYQIFQLFPVQITEPCRFRARALTEIGELRGGSLIVSLGQPTYPASTPPTDPELQEEVPETGGTGDPDLDQSM
jgi:hypothetical protein